MYSPSQQPRSVLYPYGAFHGGRKRERKERGKEKGERERRKKEMILEQSDSSNTHVKQLTAMTAESIMPPLA